MGGGCGEGAPKPPTSPACSQKCWRSLSGYQEVVSARLPHRADSSSGAGASPGAGRVPPASRAFPHASLDSAVLQSPHQLRDINTLFF